VGSPKYSDQLIGPYPGLDAKFGFDPRSFDRTILIGTKDLRGRWGIHNVTDRFHDELESLVQRNERTLFIIRPHPKDSAEAYARIQCNNVVLFDELVGVLSDTPLCRVMPYVDVLATSPSSLVVDGAVSNKPIFVYDTGQPVEFENVQARRFSDLEDQTKSQDGLTELTNLSRDLKGRYAEAVDDSFYKKFGDLLNIYRQPDLDLFVAAAATLTLQAVENARAAARSEARATSLAADLSAQRSNQDILLAEQDRGWIERTDKLRRDLSAALAHSGKLGEQNASILSGIYWRLTALAKKIVTAFRVGCNGRVTRSQKMRSGDSDE
jgi:CDP-glycerol glycerophosphotransferase (TagB/SpsB family)